jgi:maltooligosyltrehalose synthase
LTTFTHDTKRSADVRARASALRAGFAPDAAAELRVREYGRSLLESAEVDRFVELVRPIGRNERE